jgi:hypothetical protein
VSELTGASQQDPFITHMLHTTSVAVCSTPDLQRRQKAHCQEAGEHNCIVDAQQQGGRRRAWCCRGRSAHCHNQSALLLAAVLLTCGSTSRTSDLYNSRRQSVIKQHDSAHPLRCATATVQRPTIGQCIDVFSKPVPLRVCVHNESEAQDRVDFPTIGPRARYEALSKFSNSLLCPCHCLSFVLILQTKQTSHRGFVAVCKPSAGLRQPAVPFAVARLGGASHICLYMLRRAQRNGNLQRAQRLFYLYAGHLHPAERSP